MLQILGNFFKSIRFKITLTFSVTFAGIFMLISIFIYEQVRKIIFEADNKSLLSRAELLLSKTEISPVIIPIPNEDEEIKVQYLKDTLSRTIYASENFPTDHITGKDFSGVIDNTDQRTAIVRKNLDEDDDEVIQLSLIQSNTFLKTQLRSLLYLLILADTISIILAAYLSFILSRLILKPVQSIIRTARTINAGKKIKTIEVSKTGDEIQLLTETLNDMFKRIETGLQQQTNFFASAAHELRTPLSIIRTSIEVNLKNKQLPDTVVVLLQNQLEEINRLNRIVEDFLLVSQLKNPELILRIQSVALDDLTLEIVDKFNGKIKASGLQLVVNFDSRFDNYHINCDPDKISNVIINLLENALKYAVPKSKIHLTVSKDSANQTMFEVTNKIEKPIENFDKLSQEFYQSDIMKDGYGMGLWISHKIITLHGGQLELTQEKQLFNVKIFFSPRSL